MIKQKKINGVRVAEHHFSYLMEKLGNRILQAC